MPISQTANSDARARRNTSKAIAVTHSKKVGCAARRPAASNSSMASRTRVNVAANSASEISLPSRRMRSLMRSRCGDVYRPVRKPAARRIDSSIAAVEPLPFVPGDVHGLKRALRLPQVLAKHGDVFQVEFRGAGLPRRGEFASQAEEVLDRFFVGHAATPGKNRARRRCRSSGPCGGPRRREIRVPAEIPRSEIPWEVSGGWSARSRAARRSRSARRARRC